MFFNEESLSKLGSDFQQMGENQDALIIGFLKLELNDKASEYTRHGFLRRLSTLNRCITNIYEICPPEDGDKLSTEEHADLSINLQSFVFNVFGAIDNLAWIWVEEFQILGDRGRKIPNIQVGLRPQNAAVLASFSEGFQNRINDLNESGWFGLLEGFRHSLAHRIPLYVPPCIVTGEEADQFVKLENAKSKALDEHNFVEYKDANDEQDKLGKFIPWMVHSIEEGSPNVVFHAQVLSDWNTVCDIANGVLDEINLKLADRG